MSTDGFDTVRFFLDKYSEQAVKELHEIKDENELAEKKKDILDYFTKVCESGTGSFRFAFYYFERRGFEKNFNYTYCNNNLEMIK